MFKIYKNSCTTEKMARDKGRPRFAKRGLPYQCEQVCKPGSVLNGHLSRRIVAGALQPPRERTGRPVAPIAVLLRIEFTATDTFTSRRVSSYLAFPPLPRRRRSEAGRYISVALFLKSPSAGVTRYPCPVEPGLSSWTGFCLIPATVWLTRTAIVQDRERKVNRKAS